MSLAVVTGANRGIGLALVEQLVGRALRVVAVCRKSSPALAKLRAEVIEGVDVAVPEGIETLTRALGSRRISLLINNAGILVEEGALGSIDFSEVLRQFEVNAMGPLRVTQALLPNLERGSKVGLVTSPQTRPQTASSPSFASDSNNGARPKSLRAEKASASSVTSSRAVQALPSSGSTGIVSIRRVSS